jgi:glycosyltransferase involved in cell wall biosynthesis
MPCREFDFGSFNSGDYNAAADARQRAENISAVLYPSDSTHSGKELRLKQQYFFASATLRDVIRRERPTVVHSHNWMVRSFLPLKRWSKASLVATVHDYSLSCANWILMRDGDPCSGPALIKCIECAKKNYAGLAKGAAVAVGNWTMSGQERRLVDMFVPVSAAVAAGNQLPTRKTPYRIIPNFIPDDVGALGDESYRDQLPADGYLLFVGSLTHQKGIRTLLDAYAGLTGAPPLVLIGYTMPDTPETFPDNVVVLKNWPHAAVMTAWRHSLAGIVPSIWPDPCPTVAMEAMAVGKPVIASRIGGLPDIVADGETGILVPPGDVDALRAALARLIDDPDLAARMGAAGRDRVGAFHASTVITAIESVYEEVSA